MARLRSLDNVCANCTLNLTVNQRELYVASTDLAPLAPQIVYTGIAPTPSGNGYWLVDSSGTVHPFGNAGSYGSMAGTTLNAPINHLVPTTDGGGYWMVAADGGIFAFGDAPFYGSMGGKPLNAPWWTWLPLRMVAGTGSSPRMVVSSRSATPPSTVSWVAST